MSDEKAQVPPEIPPDLSKHPLVRLLGVCYGLCLIGVVAIFIVIVVQLDMSRLSGQTFAVRLLQATLAMLIGATFAIMGVVAVLLGLVEATKVAVTGWGKAAAAGPGGLLVICGTVIICLSLMREFSITEREGGADLQNIDQADGSSQHRRSTSQDRQRLCL